MKGMKPLISSVLVFGIVNTAYELAKTRTQFGVHSGQANDAEDRNDAAGELPKAIAALDASSTASDVSMGIEYRNPFGEHTVPFSAKVDSERSSYGEIFEPRLGYSNMHLNVSYPVLSETRLIEDDEIYT